jgi:hypothetical protein
MGYESRLYVIRKTNVMADKGFKYAETMVIYEMGKFPPFQELFGRDSCPATKFCPCAGDNYIVEDMYGDPLRERSLGEVIRCLEQVMAINDCDAKYPRVLPLLALLREYQKIQNGWYDIAILHYGH